MNGTDAKAARVGNCKKCGKHFDAPGSRGAIPSLCQDCGPKSRGRPKPHQRKCVGCGNLFWIDNRRRQFCSRDCMVASRERDARREPCKNCGVAFRCTASAKRSGRAYCSDKCREDSWGKRESVSCVVCGTEFKRRPKASENKCCSHKCGHELKRINAAPRKAARIARQLEAKFLRNYRAVANQIARDAERKRKAEELRPCLRCQRVFRNGKDLLCSDECRKLSRKINKKAGRRSRASHTHYERCRIRGLPFDSSVDRSFVFERDAGLCLLCGELTRSGDRERAPTIGHIVPLNNPLNTRHGHTKENTFTNCAKCNGRQGNAVMIDGHQNSDDPRGSYLERIRSAGCPLR